MVMLPVLPVLEGESLVSWVGRVSRFHLGGGPFQFLNTIELNRKEVLDATPVALERLAGLAGVPQEVLSLAAYRRIGTRLYQYRGEVFSAEFIGRDRTTYCPACLLEDDAPGGARVGRLNWGFAPVRTCPRHRIPLVRHKIGFYAETFQDMALVAPEDAVLTWQAKDAPTRAASPLQSYVEARLAGARGPAWLDGQQIDQASRACEMLGVALLHEARIDLPGLTEAQWDEAGAAGFDHAERGVAGLHEAFALIHKRFRDAGGKGGPQAVFGRLYQWLQFRKNQKDPGPIADVLRDYILDTMAIAPGTRVFDQVLDTRRRHSVQSLSKASGIHIRTLNRALVRTGLLPAADEDQLDGMATVDVELGEALADRIQNSIPVKDIPAYINCHRTQAERLVRQGIIVQIAPDRARASGVLSNVAVEDLDRFLERLRARGRQVERPGVGMMNMIEASEAARWPTLDIVRLVLEGALDRIELLDAGLGFKSVLVDPAEVKVVLDRRAAQERLAAADVAKALSITSSGVRHLVSYPDRDGRPFLVPETVKNSKGAVRHYFTQAEIDRFRATYVTLAELVASRGQSAKAIRKAFAEAGIAPIMPRPKLEAYVYRRSDI